MRNKTIVGLALTMLFFSAIKINAQTAFDKGTVVVTAGLGFPDLSRLTQAVVYNGYNGYSVHGFGPILIKGDYGIIKFKWGHSVGVGAVIGLSTTSITYNYTDPYYQNGNGWPNGVYTEKDSYTRITVGARGSYHFFTKEKIDCYAGVGLGYIFNLNSQTTTDPRGIYNSAASFPSIYESFTVGIRYYFTKNIGVYAEGGWDMSAPIQGGLAIKF